MNNEEEIEILKNKISVLETCLCAIRDEAAGDKKDFWYTYMARNGLSEAKRLEKEPPLPPKKKSWIEKLRR